MPEKTSRKKTGTSGEKAHVFTYLLHHYTERRGNAAAMGEQKAKNEAARML